MSHIQLIVDGVVQFDNGQPIVPPNPTDPVPVPPYTPPTGYEGPDMWNYATRVLHTGEMKPGDVRKAHYVVPQAFIGWAEVNISGLNLKVFVDGADSPDGPIPNGRGPHAIEVHCVNGTADGTVTVQHG